MSEAWLILRGCASAARARWREIADRHAARTARSTPVPRSLVFRPDPPGIGSFARAQAMLRGEFAFAGITVNHSGAFWEVRPPSPAFEDAMQAGAWTADLAATGDRRSLALLRAAVFGWIDRYGGGGGPGWRPDLAGARLWHWAAHADAILRGAAPADERRFVRALARHGRFLLRRAHRAPADLPRFTALAGLCVAGVALEGEARLAVAGVRALGRECARAIGPDGGLASRNPEELAEVFAVLVAMARMLEAAGKQPDPRHAAAIARMAPALRTLRMGDGGLARFHGGRAGPAARLDQALADARIRAPARRELTMGYMRLAAGRTICLIDAARPPAGRASLGGHAGTLGIEVSSGRRPLIASIGAGTGFGPEWQRPARATAAHSTAMVERASSSRILAEGLAARLLGPRLAERPQTVTAERSEDSEGAWLRASHDGYVPTHGLVHERRLFLGPDGRDLKGEDTLAAVTDAHKRLFARTVAAAPRLGVAFTVIFHIHPDVEVRLAPGGGTVALLLPSGEEWSFRQSGGALELAESVWLDHEALRPRATKQVVVTGRAVDYFGRVSWAFSRTGDGPRHRRDAAALAGAV
jgi:uncharacterized heparinase superfamily protein